MRRQDKNTMWLYYPSIVIRDCDLVFYFLRFHVRGSIFHNRSCEKLKAIVFFVSRLRLSSPVCGSVLEQEWACCGPEWWRDARGIYTTYDYDADGRTVYGGSETRMPLT